MQCPRETRYLEPRRIGAYAANRWSSTGVRRNINDDVAPKFSVPIKYLDAVIATISHIDISVRIDSDAVGRIELSLQKIVRWHYPHQRRRVQRCQIGPLQ